MTIIDSRDVPADETSRQRLRTTSLDYRVVDLSDDTQAEPYQRAVHRGFLGGEPSLEVLTQERSTLAARRTVGVFEEDAPAGARPIGTVDAWVTPMTVPGGEIDMWAISGVTVATTHRRRGIARALLEGELRAAASAGIALVGLTVSEATIYGRYGFGSALPAVRYTIDTRRAGWAGFKPTGRLEYREPADLADDLAAAHERDRGSRSGRIPGWPERWQGFAGLSAAETDRDKVRGVRYLDDAGDVQGVIVYALEERGGTFRYALRVRALFADTDDARAALWRFAVQHDLVDEVTADLQTPDDPLPWLVADPRGVTQEIHDHGWLRIVDLPRALAARRYAAPLDLTIRIDDPLDFTSGVWRVRVDGEGVATVEPGDGEPDATLGIAALSSMYAGGVRAGTLRGAGRLSASPAITETLDRAFAAFPAPSLDIWY